MEFQLFKLYHNEKEIENLEGEFKSHQKSLKKAEKKREDIEEEVREKKREQGQINRELATVENQYQLKVSNGRRDPVCSLCPAPLL